MKTVILALVFIVCVAPFAFAQTVPNPTKVEFTVSADHASLSKYLIGYFLPGATDPVQTADIPITAPDASQKVTQPINATPLGFGTYVARMKAYANGVSSEWSEPSNEFSRIPFPPASPVVKK